VTPAHTYEATLKDNGEFCIKNTGSIPRTFYAYAYKVFTGGEQSLIDKQKATVAPGDSFCGTLPTEGCETQFDLSGTDSPAGKINGGEIAHKVVKKDKPCVIDCVVGEWSGWGEVKEETQSCTGSLCRYRKILTAPAYGGKQCPSLKECREYDNTFTPQASVSCVYDQRHLEYDCKATSSVGAHFSWNPDYDPIFTANTCNEQDKESFKKYKLTWQEGLEKLDKVYVTVDPCNACGKNVTVMFDVQ